MGFTVHATRQRVELLSVLLLNPFRQKKKTVQYNVGKFLRNAKKVDGRTVGVFIVVHPFECE
jgi:hypothetical protein